MEGVDFNDEDYINWKRSGMDIEDYIRNKAFKVYDNINGNSSQSIINPSISKFNLQNNNQVKPSFNFSNLRISPSSKKERKIREKEKV
jgi:hypothetical protein